VAVSSQEAFDRELGQLLVARGVLSAAELQEALTEQVVAGGTLALNLWEIGLAGIDELTSTGAAIVGLPPVDFERALRAGPESLERIDADFVRRTELCPFEVEGKRLRVATARPWQIDLLDEARFKSGLAVEPCFMSDVALRRLLHRRCGITPPPRYRARPMFRPWRGSQAQARPPAAEEARGEELTSEAEFLALYAPERAGAEPAKPDVEPDVCEEVPLSEVEFRPATITPIRRAEDALLALEGASDRRALGEILVRFGLSCARRVALFTCRKDVWLGWTGGGADLTPERVATVMVPAVPGSVFALVQDGGAPYLGPLPDHPIHHAFRLAIGHAEAGSVGLFPVRHKGRVLFVIYLEAGGGAPLDVSQVLVLAQRVPLTLERVAARRRG
jgi:hypothetical protein